MSDDREKEDSVYDFLYTDSARMSVFLSQFYQYGDLTQITKRSSTEDVVGGGIKAVFASAEVKEKGTETVEEQFDSKNLAPLRFLDEANRKRMIVRNSVEARIGQLVLITGALKVLDMALLKGLWSMASVKSGLNAAYQEQQQQSRSGRTRSERRRDHSAKEQTSPPAGDLSPIPSFVSEFLTVMPHTVQGQINQEGRVYWFSLKPQFLTVDSTNLLMQHGIDIAGEWSTLAILDALPNNGAPSHTDATVSTVNPVTGIAPLFSMLEHSVAPMTQAMLGRQSQFYGVTPILIFREVNGCGE